MLLWTIATLRKRLTYSRFQFLKEITIDVANTGIHVILSRPFLVCVSSTYAQVLHVMLFERLENISSAPRFILNDNKNKLINGDITGKNREWGEISGWDMHNMNVNSQCSTVCTHYTQDGAGGRKRRVSRKREVAMYIQALLHSIFYVYEKFDLADLAIVKYR